VIGFAACQVRVDGVELIEGVIEVHVRASRWGDSTLQNKEYPVKPNNW
jgi:hypothetical protein